MDLKPINFQQKFSLFSKLWSPRIIAQMNDNHFKIAKIQGEFVWHCHPGTDEVFIVMDGRLRIHFRDGDVSLEAGEMFVVPKGVDHKPSAKEECQILMVEPAGTLNTGDAGGDRTIEGTAWI